MRAAQEPKKAPACPILWRFLSTELHASCLVLAMLMLAVAPLPCAAQPGGQDTTYVRDHSRRVTLRLYGSHKFNSMLLRAQDPHADLRYRPNGQINFGVGASLRKLTLNIGVRMPFVNDDDDRKGRTRYLDAQANLYGTKQASNLFLQVYKGYHITSHTKEQTGWEGSTALPYRPDVLQYNFGISSLRILNHRRFGYRAGFNQDAEQLRSQGTWLVGGYLTGFVVRADSALVPSLLRGQFPHTGAVQGASLYDVGPMVGYAYTHVLGRKWFATVSGAVGVGASAQVLRAMREEGLGSTTYLGGGWHTQLRAAAGYNTRLRYVGVLFTQEHVGYLQQAQEGFVWDVGLVRVVFAQRFGQRPKAMDRGTRWLQRKGREVLPAP
ncbi:MAG: DUF4421 family protein [Flavobacteriales bacterium]|nr:DUF4421 family protein [Flavobacteriales bacterium]